MFREFLNVLRKKSLFSEALDESVRMLLADQKMFKEAQRSLRESDDGELKIDVFGMDKKINKYERDVRKKVLTHLVVSGAQDLQVGLALVSVVIDIERIGDFTKNIANLATAHSKRLSVGTFEKKLKSIEKRVKDFFNITVQAFQESDTELAQEVIRKYPKVSRDCDDIIGFLIEGKEEIDVSDAVTLGLYLRYLKRVAAHLFNISTSVVNPFYRIGFKMKKKKV